MPSIREQLEASGLHRIAGSVETAAKASARLWTGESSEDGVSRLGGRANLPEETAWPVWQGKPLAFIAQVDLAALPFIEGVDLPHEGSLHFFYEGGETAWGFDPKDRGAWVVMFNQGALRDWPLRKTPDGVPDFLRFPGAAIAIKAPELTIPDRDDPILDRFQLTFDERDRYWDLLIRRLEEEAAETYHRIGGYPECIQNDPKLEAHLVSQGYYCGDPSGYNQAKQDGRYAGADAWELLLQVDSDDTVGMMWGDVGRIYFLIHRDDLRARRFDKTWLVFQCS